LANSTVLFGKRLSKQKMTIFSKNLGGHRPFGPLVRPMRKLLCYSNHILYGPKSIIHSVDTRFIYAVFRLSFFKQYKIYCFKLFKSRVRHNYGADFKRITSYNSPATIATELFKPSTDSASLLVSIKKNVVRFGWGFSLGDVTKKAGF